ncbi:hypothetical protein N9B24_02740 [bacterium]|nr:hypothetical protein [bacterium]
MVSDRRITTTSVFRIATQSLHKPAKHFGLPPLLFLKDSPLRCRSLKACILTFISLGKAWCYSLGASSNEFGGCQAKFVCRENSDYSHLPTTNRFEIVEEPLRFYEDQTRSLESDESFSELIKPESDGFTFIDSDKYRLLGNEWLDPFSLAGFFFAVPGTTYRMSHICVESLAMGMVPVLEYASVFRSALTGGFNCLTYQGKEGFRRTLKRLQNWGLRKSKASAKTRQSSTLSTSAQENLPNA